MAALRQLAQGQSRILHNLHSEVSKVGSIVFIQSRDASSSQLALYKKGKGGRSSFSGIVATVFGGSGFMARYIVNKLGKMGSQVICPYRNEPYHYRHLKLAGDLGQILFMEFDIRDEESIRKAMKHSNVVINLLGRDWETRNFSYKDVHVDGAQRIARAANEMGVQKLIHFSALNASPDPPKIYMKEGSEWLKSKYRGELRVKEEFPDAIIFRPAPIYGSQDRFLRYYANEWRRHHNMLPLWKLGKETVKMPVFCGDVAEGVVKAILDKDSAGNTYECVGPNAYYLSDLVDYFYRCMRYENMRKVWINPVFRTKMFLQEQMPNEPRLHKEKLEFEHISDTLTGCPTLEDLGVNLTRLEDRANWELMPFRRHAYYQADVGEFADPEPPPVLS